ncbi:hypothetical protein HK405_012878, partial [Cladochytrium tenue]
MSPPRPRLTHGVAVRGVVAALSAASVPAATASRAAAGPRRFRRIRASFSGTAPGHLLSPPSSHFSSAASSSTPATPAQSSSRPPSLGAAGIFSTVIPPPPPHTGGRGPDDATLGDQVKREDDVEQSALPPAVFTAEDRLESISVTDLLPPDSVVSALQQRARAAGSAVPPPTLKSVRRIATALLDVCRRNLSDDAAIPVLLAAPPAGKKLGYRGFLLAAAQLRSSGGGGSADAEFRAARLLSAGAPGLPRDERAALREVERLARSVRHPAAMYVLGMRLAGSGVDAKDQHANDAVELIRAAADAGMPVACAQMGHMYRSGQLVERDPSRALPYLERAAAAGHVEAAFLAGTLYAAGDGVEKDPRRAFELYLQAANQGLAVAQHNVGAAYFSDEPAESGAPRRDVPRAIEYWGMAAEQGLAAALFNLGRLHAEGFEPRAGIDPPGWRVVPNRERARAALRAAAANPHADAEVARAAEELMEAAGLR